MMSVAVPVTVTVVATATGGAPTYLALAVGQPITALLSPSMKSFRNEK